MAAARFLGWRQKGENSKLLSPLPELAPVLPSASSSADASSWLLEPATPRDRDPQTITRAEWSDASSFGTSDGFNLAKWRAECTAELEAAAVHRRWAKPLAKPGRLSPLGDLGEEFTATFVKGACSDSDCVIQRGLSTFVKTTKQLSDKEQALRMRQNAAEVSKQNRRLAAKWREQKERALTRTEDPEQGVLAHHCTIKAPTKEESDDRRKRVFKAISRIQSTRLKANSEDFIIDAFRSSVVVPPEQRRASVELKKKEEEMLAIQRRAVRSRIKDAVNGHLEHRVRHARKVMRRREKWKAHLAKHVSALPEALRQIIKEAFNLYARSNDTEMGIHYSDIRKALTYVGVNGNSGREKMAVERACAETASNILKQYSRFEKTLVQPDDTECDFGHEPTFNVNRDTVLADDAYTKHLIDFEEFCAEVVANARKELSTVRQDAHFSEFQTVLREKNHESVFLTIYDFKRLALRLNMDCALIDKAITNLCPNAKIAGHRATTMGGVQEAKWRTDITLDFHTVHGILMDLEQHNAHLSHKRELEIKAKADLNDEVFWQYTGMLVRLHDIFYAIDTNRCDCLDFTETKLALHHLGFQPHRPREIEAVDMLLKLCDVDGSQTFNFREYLDIVGRLRMHQRGARQAKLRHEFGIEVKAELARSNTEEEKRRLNRNKATSFIVDRDPTVSQDRLPFLVNNALGLNTKNTRERELLNNTTATACEGDIRFSVFEELCQTIQETLNREEVHDQIADAESLGISSAHLGRYQAAFDSARSRDNPFINFRDVPKIVRELLAQLPPKEELDQLMEDLLKKNSGSHEISFLIFIRFMCSFSPSTAKLATSRPFTVDSVPEKKLRQILQLFPVSPEYIDAASASELPDVVATFLGVRPFFNLREHKVPICNIRQLVMYAQKRAPMHHVFKSTEDLTNSMFAAVSQIQLQGEMA